jgi:hypothetical protein
VRRRVITKIKGRVEREKKGERENDVLMGSLESNLSDGDRIELSRGHVSTPGLNFSNVLCAAFAPTVLRQ